MTDRQPPGETWDLWRDQARGPALNMAFDEALLVTSAERGRPLLRFYGWDRPAVSIGYVQTVAAAPSGFAVVRRPTGGGVVFHDHDFTYTAVFPAGHWLTGLDRTRSYRWINRSVQDGLERCRLDASLADTEIEAAVDRLTMVCFQNPTRYDILLNGRKVGGSAQRRTRDGILHQGSVHFGGPLPMDRDTLARALEDGFRSVMGVSFKDFEPGPGLSTTAAHLAASKYGTAAWNERR